MQVIGQNDHGLDSKRSTLAGGFEHSPKIVNVFGQKFSAAFQERDREKNVPPGTKARIYCGMISGYFHAEGGIRSNFPAYGY
jgi:hypothetical protein